jgi:hypothetical protein
MQDIKDAKSLVLWLDTDVPSQVASAYLAGGQALMDKASPTEVMEKVRATARQLQRGGG